MSDLDDFFSKRDKKKKGAAKSKFITLDTDEFAKQLETITATEEAATTAVDSANTPSDATTDGTTSVTQSGGFAEQNSGTAADGDEWKPFESEESKDYSGLRIKIQQLKEDDEDFDAANAYDENDKKPLCPWGSNAAQRFTPQQDTDDIDYSSVKIEKKPESEVVETKPAESATAATPSTGLYVSPAMRARQAGEAAAAGPKPAAAAPGSENKYVPPSMRKAMGGDSYAGASSGGSSSSNAYSIPTTSVNYRRPGKAQPNINDTSDFPSLGGAEPEKLSNGGLNGNDEKFEVAKKSARVEQKSGDNKIDLINKFSSLSTDNN